MMLTRILVLLLLILFVGWALGVRIHFQEIPAYFQKDLHHGYHRIDLKDGRQILGVITGETEQTLMISMAGAGITFERSKISQIHELTPAELKSEKYEDLFVSATKNPIVTIRDEDNLKALILAPKKEKEPSKGMGPIIPRPDPHVLQQKMADAQQQMRRVEREMMR